MALKRNEADNPLAEATASKLLDPKRVSQSRIYDSVMQGGGEPFGAPFEVGVSTLTQKVVKLFKQMGFFNFETLEKLRERNRRNKFTRHGAAPYLGELKVAPAKHRESSRRKK